MSSGTLVSIIVPCYNCEDTLRRCVNSIINQSHNEIEIILIDDGSEDNTSVLCDKFASEDNRVIVKHQTNSGLVCAWKAGVKLASGDYVAFCDSDDYIDDDMIGKVLSYADEYDADLVTYGIKAEYTDGSQLLMKNSIENGYYDGDIFEKVKSTYLFSGKMLSQKILNNRVCKLMKKSVLDNVLDDISDELTNGEDAVTSYAVIVNSRNMYNISDYYPYHYMRNDQSMIGKLDENWFSKMDLMRQELMKLSRKYDINHDWQIENFFFSYVLMFTKKEISRGSNKSETIANIINVRNSETVKQSLDHVDVSGYSISSRLFANLYVKERFHALYFITKLAALLGYGKQ